MIMLLTVLFLLIEGNYTHAAKMAKVSKNHKMTVINVAGRAIMIVITLVNNRTQCSSNWNFFCLVDPAPDSVKY